MKEMSSGVLFCLFFESFFFEVVRAVFFLFSLFFCRFSSKGREEVFFFLFFMCKQDKNAFFFPGFFLFTSTGREGKGGS